jgi:hypothetical protein
MEALAAEKSQADDWRRSDTGGSRLFGFMSVLQFVERRENLQFAGYCGLPQVFAGINSRKILKAWVLRHGAGIGKN